MLPKHVSPLPALDTSHCTNDFSPILPASLAKIEALLSMIQEAPEITKKALDGSDPAAVETVNMFLAILGQEAGANSLRVLAQGGVYLCGGILPRVGFC